MIHIVILVIVVLVLIMMLTIISNRGSNIGKAAWFLLTTMSQKIHRNTQLHRNNRHTNIQLN